MSNIKEKLLLKMMRMLMGLVFMVLLITSFTIYWYLDPNFKILQALKPTPPVERPVYIPEIIDGVHTATGFKAGEGLQVVITNCTACHSSKLVTQNRATKEGWKSMIKWMQETQNLWDLGDNEEVILNYLAKHYAPTKKGRRANLKNIDWYDLEQ